jgi:hypothetical protein
MVAVMSIFIRGMEMPESCYYCPFMDGSWGYSPQHKARCIITGEEMPIDDRDVQHNSTCCPLIEVSTPNGDLIDRDALKDVQQWDADLFKGSSDYGEKCRYDEAINAVANIVNAPTIIDAEDGDKSC